MKTKKSAKPQSATTTARRVSAIQAPAKPKASRPRDAQAYVPGPSIAEQEQEIRDVLAQLVTPEEAERWLHAPQRRFDDKSPLEMIQRGRSQEVLQMIVYVDEVGQV